MKLLLTSAGLTDEKIKDFFISVLPVEPKDCSALMITYTQTNDEQFYIDESKQQLIRLGITNIDTFNLTEEEFLSTKIYNIIYVCGGNTFAILNRMKITKIDEFIKKTVKKGETIYVGVSAGSIIAGPNIEIAGWGSEGDINEIGLVDLFGLGLTDFSVYPHFKDYLKQEVEEFKNEVNYLVFELTDNDAIWQDEKGRKLIL